jgi:hypothetical protein
VDDEDEGDVEDGERDANKLRQGTGVAVLHFTQLMTHMTSSDETPHLPFPSATDLRFL